MQRYDYLPETSKMADQAINTLEQVDRVEQQRSQETMEQMLSRMMLDLKTDLSTKMAELSNDVGNKLNTNTTLMKEMEARVTVSLTHLKEDISAQLETHSALVDGKLRVMNDDLNLKLVEYQEASSESIGRWEAQLMQHKLDVETKVERISSFVTDQGDSISSLSLEVGELKSSMDSRIAVAAKEMQSSRSNEIERENLERKKQVEQLVAACNNGAQFNPGLAKPNYYRDGRVKKFGGTIMENPIEHLRYLNSILNDIFWSDIEKLRVAESSFTGSALLWWRTAYQDFATYQAFEGAYHQEFWSVQKQCELRTRLYAEKYLENGSRSLEEHFVMNWERSRHMTPPMEDTEFICMLVSQLSLRLQNILLRAHRGTVSQLREDLRKLDQIEWVQTRNRNLPCNQLPREGDNNSSSHKEKEQQQSAELEPCLQDDHLRSSEEYRPPNKKTRKWRNKRNSWTNEGSRGQNQSHNESPENDCLAYCIPDDLKETLLEEGEEEGPKSSPFNLELSWHVWDREVKAILDTGASVSCISQQLFQELQQEFMHLPVLPVPQTCIVGASGKRSAIIDTQVLLNLRRNRFQADWSFLVVKSLAKPIIIGMDFIMKHVSRVDFEQNIVTLRDQHGEPVELNVTLDSSLEEKSMVQLSLQEDVVSEEVEPRKSPSQGQPNSHHDKEDFVNLIKTMDHLSGEQKEELLRVLWEHQGTFSEVPGRNLTYQARIRLSEEQPFFQKSYPIPIAYREDVDRQIQQMLNWDIIERCSSPYASPLCCVIKKDATVRLCLDARQLNLRIIKDRESPTPPEEILQWCEEVRVLSSTDLTHGYWQLSLHPDDRKYVAFLYKTRSYCFKVLPFGIANAVAEFTRCMDEVLWQGCKGFARAYLDDIIVHSRSFEEHLQHLRSVFTRITESGMTLKLKKSLFCREEMPFLGFIVTPRGVMSDPGKLKIIQEFPTPKNIKQLKGFLGILGFYRKFTTELATVTEPLFALLKKGIKWRWDAITEAAFQAAKQLFVVSCTLYHPVLGVEFVLTTDASSYALGAKLSQIIDGEERVIAMSSRLLNSAERHYTVTERECLGFVWALQRFRSIVLGSPLLIRTDHKALTFMLNCKIHSSRIRRWILAIQEFDYQIQYVKGAENEQVDALSRHLTGVNGTLVDEENFAPAVHEVLRIQLGEDPVLEKEFKKLRQLQRDDPTLGAICEIIETPKPDKGPANLRMRNLYCVKDGILHRLVNGIDPFNQHWKVCVPEVLQSSLIWYVHHKNGHFGGRKCYWQARKFFYWSKMEKHFKREIATCELCQKAKYPNTSFSGAMQPILPEEPNMLVSVDIFGPLPVGQRGLKYLLVFLDCFSKFCRIYPLTTATTASCLEKVRLYVTELGAPRAIITDHGTQFVSKKWYDGIKGLKIVPTHASIRHPASNPVERTNREIGRILRTYCHRKHTTWPACVDFMNVILNNVVQESTGQTPVTLHFGQPADYDWYRKLCKVEADQLPEHKALINTARKKLISSAQRRRKVKRKPHEFNVGDLVLVKEKPTSNFFSKETKKLFLIFSGPYHIIRIVRENAFELWCAKKQTIKGVFNAANLKPFKTLDNDGEH